MDETTGKNPIPPFKEKVYVGKQESVHLAKERLASLVLRSQLTDTEYQHLKECSECVETVKLLQTDQQGDRVKGMSAGSK